MADESRERENGASGDVHSLNCRSRVVARWQSHWLAVGRTWCHDRPHAICYLRRKSLRQRRFAIRNWLWHAKCLRLWQHEGLRDRKRREENYMLGTILLIVLILLLLGAVPAWPYNRSWGYAPSGGIGLVLMVVLILVLLRHI